MSYDSNLSEDQLFNAIMRDSKRVKTLSNIDLLDAFDTLVDMGHGLFTDKQQVRLHKTFYREIISRLERE